MTEQIGRQRELAPSRHCDALVGKKPAFPFPHTPRPGSALVSVHPVPYCGTVEPPWHCCSLTHSLIALLLELGKYGTIHILRPPAVTGWRGISKLTLQTLTVLSSFGSELLLQIIWFIHVYWLMGKERWERGKGTSANETGKPEQSLWSK